MSGVSRRSVVHKLDAGQGTGSYTFTFDWTAPATNSGDVTFYFAGNAADGDGTEDGDYIYLSSMVCPFNLSNGIKTIDNSTSISVYPMPVKDYFTMDYDLTSTGIVNIKLYSIRGELVSILTSEIMTKGKHSDKFYLPTALSSGNYILSIESQTGTNCRKILIN